MTAASRAYLMEPHWNPMIEEQALCRVHRVGQTRRVTTIRYLMRDSFEEVGSYIPTTLFLAQFISQRLALNTQIMAIILTFSL